MIFTIAGFNGSIADPAPLDGWPGPLPPASKPDESADAERRMVIPGQADDLADEIARISTDGRPADPKSGPRLLRWEIGGMFLLVALFSLGVGWWAGLAAGLVTLAVGSIGLIVNPAVGAAAARASEREEVARHHAADRDQPPWSAPRFPGPPVRGRPESHRRLPRRSCENGRHDP